MCQWKSATSHSQRSADRSERKVIAKVGVLNLTVTRHIHHDPDVWVASCPPFFEGVEISRGTLDDAKAKAIGLLGDRLERSLSDLRNLAGA